MMSVSGLPPGGGDARSDRSGGCLSY